MSIEVQFYTVVVRRDALERLSTEARQQFFATWGADDIFREDAHLVATGFMNPRDVEACADQMEALGLRVRDEVGAFLDLAVVQEGFGFPFPCPWLALSWEGKSMQETQAELQDMFGEGTHLISLGKQKAVIPHCWHKDFPPGPLSEVPFLKAKPELREGESYVLLPDDRGKEAPTAAKGADSESP